MTRTSARTDKAAQRWAWLNAHLWERGYADELAKEFSELTRAVPERARLEAWGRRVGRKCPSSVAFMGTTFGCERTTNHGGPHSFTEDSGVAVHWPGGGKGSANRRSSGRKRGAE